MNINVFAALAVGYVVGAKTAGKELDQLGRTLKALYETDEFADVISAARAHVGRTLRDVAGIVDGESGTDSGVDLVDRVRHLVGHD